MRLLATLIVAGFSLHVLAPAAEMTGFPFTDEDLNYSVNWPSGLSLGEAHLHARHSNPNWRFEFDIDAGVPGYQVKDVYRSQSTTSFCSVSFDRLTSHGGHRVDETETVNGTQATRETLNGGGTSQLAVPDCVKDALTFLYFAAASWARAASPQASRSCSAASIRPDLTMAANKPFRWASRPRYPTNHLHHQRPHRLVRLRHVLRARPRPHTPARESSTRNGMFSLELTR